MNKILVVFLLIISSFFSCQKEKDGVSESYIHYESSDPIRENWLCKTMTDKEFDESPKKDGRSYIFKEDCNCKDIGYPDSEKGVFNISKDGIYEGMSYNVGNSNGMTAPPKNSSFPSKYHTMGEPKGSNNQNGGNCPKAQAWLDKVNKNPNCEDCTYCGSYETALCGGDEKQIKAAKLIIDELKINCNINNY